MEQLKIRCSALGNIVHFDKGTTITEKQLQRIKELESRTKALTPNMEKELSDLIAKRDAPLQLSAGAKTYIRDVFYGEKFEFIKAFTSKQTEKGNAVEDRAIKQIVEYLDLPMVRKNQTWHENDFIHGTPDVDLSVIGFQFDVKAPYLPNALQTFEDKLEHNYEWQQHGYNWLLGIRNAAVIRILMNPTEKLIEKEAWIRLKDSGLEIMNDDFMNEVRELFNFERFPIEDRIKIFTLKTEDHHIETIKTAVKLARKYWAELQSKWVNKNISEIDEIKMLTSK